ncbi:hypothetical protein GNF76_26080 [Pseudomonas sp. CCM 7893]|uniref:Uncharacterized protein n=1 Tax=Pseudomonas spelaei TaxID=1055469 RepID=A0A6I3WAV0_9PSED|nr:hypothetical protein [Pseudomonas spelaei]MUF07820.1 hypothetical protein [Pseudomonas spelaei]
MSLNELLKSAVRSASAILHRVGAFVRVEMKWFFACALGSYLGPIVFYLLLADPGTATFGDFLSVIQSSSRLISSLIAGTLFVALRGRLLPSTSQA